MREVDREVELDAPPPSPAVPWFFILVLVLGMSAVYWYFLRPAEKLSNPPLPRNEYIEKMPAPEAPETPVTTTPSLPPG